MFLYDMDWMKGNETVSVTGRRQTNSGLPIENLPASRLCSWSQLPWWLTQSLAYVSFWNRYHSSPLRRVYILRADVPTCFLEYSPGPEIFPGTCPGSHHGNPGLYLVSKRFLELLEFFNFSMDLGLSGPELLSPASLMSETESHISTAADGLHQVGFCSWIWTLRGYNRCLACLFSLLNVVMITKSTWLVL